MPLEVGRKAHAPAPLLLRCLFSFQLSCKSSLLFAFSVCHKCIVYLSQPHGDFPCSNIIPVGNVRSSHPVTFTALQHYRSYITVCAHPGRLPDPIGGVSRESCLGQHL